MTNPRLGFHVDRTITIEGPFRTHPTKDATWAHAKVETQGVTHRVVVMILGPSETVLMGSGEHGSPTDDEREEARVLFAMIELAQRSTEDFNPPQHHLLPEIRIELSPGPDSGPGYRGMWSVGSIKKHDRLRGYTVSREESTSTWTATPKP